MAEYKSVIVVQTNEAGQPTNLLSLEDGDTISDDVLSPGVRGAASAVEGVSATVYANSATWDEGIDPATLADLTTASARTDTLVTFSASVETSTADLTTSTAEISGYINDNKDSWAAGIDAGTLNDIKSVSATVKDTSGDLVNASSTFNTFSGDIQVCTVYISGVVDSNTTDIGNLDGRVGAVEALVPSAAGFANWNTIYGDRSNIIEASTLITGFRDTSGALAKKDTIDSDTLLDNNVVTTDKIANDAVTNDKIAANAVGTTEIANDAVTTDKIADSNVTLAKIENISNNTILGNNTGSPDAPSELTNIQVRALINVEDGATANTGALADKNTVATGDIDNDAVTTDKIANSNVTLAKIANISNNTILGNNTGGDAAPVALNPANVRTLINVEDGATANTGALADKDTIDSATLIANNVVSLPKIQAINHETILGNDTGTAGSPIALSPAQVRTVINVEDGATANTGALADKNTVATGDIDNDAVTTDKIANDAVTTDKIADSNVTLAKIQNINSQTILGNNTGGAAAPAALTGTQVREVINAADADTVDDLVTALYIADDAVYYPSGLRVGSSGIAFDIDVTAISNNEYYGYNATKEKFDLVQPPLVNDNGAIKINPAVPAQEVILNDTNLSLSFGSQQTFTPSSNTFATRNILVGNELSSGPECVVNLEGSTIWASGSVLSAGSGCDITLRGDKFLYGPTNIYGPLGTDLDLDGNNIIDVNNVTTANSPLTLQVTGTVNAGNLNIKNTSITTGLGITGNVDIDAVGDITLSSPNTISMEADTVTLDGTGLFGLSGGAVQIEATNTYVTIDAGAYINVESTLNSSYKANNNLTLSATNDLRLESASTDIEITTPTFDTDTFGVCCTNWNTGYTKATSPGYMARANASTQNLNATNVALELSTAVTSNGSDITWSSANPTRLTIGTTGTYRITFNIYGETSVTQRANIFAQMRIDGTTFAGPIAAGGYIRVQSGHDEASVHASFLYPLTSGQYIEIVGNQAAAAGGWNTTIGTSQVSIELIH